MSKPLPMSWTWKGFLLLITRFETLFITGTQPTPIQLFILAPAPAKEAKEEEEVAGLAGTEVVGLVGNEVNEVDELVVEVVGPFSSSAERSSTISKVAWEVSEAAGFLVRRFRYLFVRIVKDSFL